MAQAQMPGRKRSLDGHALGPKILRHRPPLGIDRAPRGRPVAPRVGHPVVAQQRLGAQEIAHLAPVAAPTERVDEEVSLVQPQRNRSIARAVIGMGNIGATASVIELAAQGLDDFM